jgi:hypothetical protein
MAHDTDHAIIVDNTPSNENSHTVLLVDIRPQQRRVVFDQMHDAPDSTTQMAEFV